MDARVGTGGEVSRLLQIARVLAAKGWAQYARPLGLVDAPEIAAPGSYAVRLREALEELGPAFVKFGQMLAGRRDLLPDELADELGKLHAQAKPFAPEEARRIIEAETGRTLDDLYEAFEAEPFAAASMAQVHRAWLHDGTAVAVKVQRPGIEATVESDIAVLRHAARLLGGVSAELRSLNLPELVEELADTLRDELDFEREGRNAERFAASNADEPLVCVPRIHWHATTRRVLTMDFSAGVRMDELPLADPARARLAAKLLRLFLAQVFEHGIFHADPHPGNVFVAAEGRICFHDFGALGELSPQLRQSLRELFLAIIAGDAEWTASSYLSMGGATGELDRAAFARDVAGALERYRRASAHGAGSFTAILHAFVRLGRVHRVRLLRETALLLRAFAEVESLAHDLDPQLDALEAFRAYSARLLRHALVPELGAGDLAGLYRSLSSARSAAAQAPIALRRLFGRLERGEPLFDVRHQSGASLERHLLHASNRLAFALIIAALIVGSAIVIAADAGPHVWGWPLLGVAGFSIAGLLGAAWGALALRSGKL